MLKRLRLYGFRNLTEQWIDLTPNTNVFVGHNGQGKSNILEALYLLLTGESFRPAETSHFVQWGRDSCSVRGEFGGAENSREDQDPFSLLLKIQNGRKSLTLDDRRLTPRDWQRLPPPILFSPESLNAIKGSAEERRRLLDELVLSLKPQAGADLADFRKCLRMRNQVLRHYREEQRSLSQTQALLEAINQKFLQLSVRVVSLRIEALRVLAPEINSAMQNVSKGFPHVDLTYWVSKESALHWTHEDIHKSLAQRLVELSGAELSSGTSLVGPQKHDIVFLFGGKDSRFFCSQGQQRSLILAFKIAQIVYHGRVLKKRPILLLDDVLSELDEEKRRNFIELIKTMDSQIVLTTTDYDLPRVFEFTEDAQVISDHQDIGRSSSVSVKRVENGSLV